VGRACKRVNTVQIVVIYVYKWKDKIFSNYSRKEGRGIKQNDGGGGINYDTL
jgi:hypothetical protein